MITYSTRMSFSRKLQAGKHMIDHKNIQNRLKTDFSSFDLDLLSKLVFGMGTSVRF